MSQTPNYRELKKHWLWGEVIGQQGNLAKAIYVNFLINFLQIFTSLFVMAVYNKVIPNSALGSLMSLALGVSVAVLFDWVFKLVKARIVNKACNDIEAALQPKLFFKVVSMDLQSRPKLSGAAATLVRDLDAVIDLFTNSSITTIISLPFVFINLLVIYLIAGSLVLVTIAISFAAFIGSLYFYWSVNQASEAAKQASIDKNSVFLEAFANLETLKSIASYSFFENKWASVNSNSRNVNTGIKLSTSDASSFNAFLLALGQVGIVTYGAFLVISGETSTGALIATVILNGKTLQPIVQLTGLMQKFSTARAGYRKLDSMFNTTSREEARRQNIRLEKLAGNIEVSDLVFHPEGLPSPILEIPRLRIKDGERVGILGSVGSGKSTLLKLLAGVLTPTSGAVVYGSFDTSAINQSDLRKNVAFLGQNPGIFGGTIRENLVFDSDDVSEEQILSTMELTGMDKMLRKFPNGLSFTLSETGRELSGGQKQILALTRALISNPTTILLDEPTSAMDPRHEHLFVNQMKPFTSNKTFLVVTHRRPILALTDRIIIIENGKLAMDGSRDEILSKFK